MLKPQAGIVQPEGVDGESVRKHVQKLILSETFDRVEEQRALLTFLVDQRLAGRQTQLSQTEIVDAKIVRRSSTPNKPVLLFPDTQAVRTHMGRLRRTLAIYYKDEGREELLQIDIPNRQYIATFSKFQSASRGKNLAQPDSVLSTPDTSEPKLLTPERLTKCAVRLYKQGKYSEAEPILIQALEMRQASLGLEHPDTATSVNNLAMLYEKQGRHKESLPLLERALGICERSMGAEHPDTLISLNNLAIGYLNAARFAEALPMFERGRNSREQLLGPEHPDTALSVNNLAMVYEKLGRYKEAIPLLEQALRTRENVLGPEHPDTALTMNNLATVYRKLARFAEALSLYERAVEICERILGPMHPDTLTIRQNYVDLSEFYNPGP